MALGGKQKGAGGQPPGEGPERSSATITDRRHHRDTRLADDVFKRLAGFTYKLLTERPR